MTTDPDAGSFARSARVQLLTRPGCHLCGPVRRTVTEVCGADGFEEIDVTTDEELEAEYGLMLPVVLVDGREIASYRLEAQTLKSALG